MASEQEAARFREAVALANIPTLLLMLTQMTGDMRWTRPPYRCGRGRGLDDNDSGGLPEDVQEEIRAAALDAILAWRDGKPVAMPEPDEATLVEMLSASMGEPVPEEYGVIVASGLGLKRDAEKPARLRAKAPEGFRAVIVGAGMSGLCAAIRLQEAGIPFDIVEAAEDVGGTWRANRYPGAGVDTPNHLYSYSFAQFDWAHYFALRGDLYAYFQKVAREHGLYDRIRFRTPVERAEWDEAAKRWRVTVRPEGGAPEVLEADVVFSGVGILDVPKWPEIPGLESFEGPCFHTARWREDVALEGRRVAVVGNGASAMQICPAIADRVEHLTIFARSPHWAAPFDKFRVEVPEPVRFLLREVPLYQAWYRQRLAWTFNDKVHPTLQKDPDFPHPERALNATNDSHRQFFTDYVKRELGERQDLLEHVLPDYPPFGKRMLLDNGWYRTVAREDVTLVPHRLAEVRGRTLIAADGSEHEADVLVVATGFQASKFIGTYEVVGRGGVSLREQWGEDDATAYLGAAIPNFPNFFTLAGPNIGLGHGGSMIGPVENQVDYLLDLLERMFERGAASVEVRRDVHDAFVADVDARHDRMVWTHPGMENWYRNKAGRVVALTPYRHDEFWRMTRRAELSDYILDHRDAAAKAG